MRGVDGDRHPRQPDVTDAIRKISVSHVAHDRWHEVQFLFADAAV
jgi:hypothetical protein